MKKKPLKSFRGYGKIWIAGSWTYVEVIIQAANHTEAVCDLAAEIRKQANGRQYVSDPSVVRV